MQVRRLIVSDTGNDVAGENYGRVVHLFGAGSPVLP